MVPIPQNEDERVFEQQWGELVGEMTKELSDQGKREFCEEFNRLVGEETNKVDRMDDEQLSCYVQSAKGKFDKIYGEFCHEGKI